MLATSDVINHKAPPNRPRFEITISPSKAIKYLAHLMLNFYPSPWNVYVYVARVTRCMHSYANPIIYVNKLNLPDSALWICLELLLSDKLHTHRFVGSGMHDQTVVTLVNFCSAWRCISLTDSTNSLYVYSLNGACSDEICIRLPVWRIERSMTPKPRPPTLKWTHDVRGA